MKILTWNVRGSGAAEKRKNIKATICKINPDFIVLQEAKRELVNRKFVGSIWRSRFKAWSLLPAMGRSGGTLIAWDSRKIKV